MSDEQCMAYSININKGQQERGETGAETNQNIKRAHVKQY